MLGQIKFTIPTNVLRMQLDPRAMAAANAQRPRLRPIGVLGIGLALAAPVVWFWGRKRI